MTTFQISNLSSGLVLGAFVGTTAEAALDAMAQEAGYSDFAASCEVTGKRADLAVVEVGALTSVPVDTIDPALLTDIDGDTTGTKLFTADYDRATVANQHYQIAYKADAGRAGIVFVGSGSGGLTSWTDCISAEDAFSRFIRGEMSA